MDRYVFFDSLIAIEFLERKGFVFNKDSHRLEMDDDSLTIKVSDLVKLMKEYELYVWANMPEIDNGYIDQGN